MKILRLKLKNFKGISIGTGKKEIEIDFSQSEHRTVILLGANGSGKSTIQSSLHPFSGTFDHRSEIIVSGTVGLKEIDILMDGIIYKIEHHYGKSTKSFIDKYYPDGTVEKLNPAGTQRSFVDRVFEEMGIREDFFQLSKIGSQAKNFIDLNSSQRKNFIGNFTPNIAEYLDAYTNVSARLSETNKEIRYITNEFDKLEPLSTVEKNIQIVSNTIKSLKAEIAKLNGKKSSINNAIESNIDIIDEIQSYTKDLEIIQSNIAHATAKIDLINSKYKNKLLNADSTQESIKEMLTVRENNVEGYKADLNEKRITLGTAKQTLASLNTELEKFNKELRTLTTDAKEDEIKSLEKNLDTLQSQVESIISKNSISQNDLNEVIESGWEGYESMSSELQIRINAKKYYEDMLAYIQLEIPANFIEHLTEIQENTMIKGNTDITDLDSISKIFDLQDKYLQDILFAATEFSNNAKEKLDTLNSEKSLYASTAKLLELCSKGSECCLYQKVHSATSDDADNNIEMVKVAYNESKVKIKEIQSSISYNNQMSVFIKKLISSRDQQYRIRTNTEEHAFIFNIFKEGVKHFDETLLLNNDLIISIIFGDKVALEKVEELLGAQINYLRAKINLSTAFRKIDSAKAEIAKYSKAAPTIELIKEKVSNIRLAKTSIESEIKAQDEVVEALANKVTVVEKVIVDLKNVLEFMNEIQLQKREEKSILLIIEKNKKTIDEITGFTTELEEINKTVAEKESSLENYEEKLSKDRLSLARIKDFNERKDNLEANRIKYSIIKDAVDIKSGAPLFLVGNYLDSIKSNTNRLLNMAYKGKFFIDFSISDKEFSIPIYKNGSKSANDIIECSQGEVSLVKTSLSLGIITQAIRNSVKHYNIVALDEIDAELDPSNKKVFVDILNKQLDSLDAEQCFVISHNDTFDSAPAAIVLLPGARIDVNDEAYMMNKDIIFQI